jgi:hypothetical protein
MEDAGLYGGVLIGGYRAELTPRSSGDVLKFAVCSIFGTSVQTSLKGSQDRGIVGYVGLHCLGMTTTLSSRQTSWLLLHKVAWMASPAFNLESAAWSLRS